MTTFFHLIVVGGGAAGFFGALTRKETSPQSKVLLLEKTGSLLSKVRVSGGGRCNVTHACFDPKVLVQNYPRGGKELLGPFTRFQPKDTIEWFNKRGVQLKTEDDGRMFPVSDSSATIIECLMGEAHRLGVEIRTRQRIEKIEKGERFCLTLNSGETLECAELLLATGSQPDGYALARSFGHSIQEPVPSLFTFNIPEFSLKELAGISVETASLTLPEKRFSQQGPLLITHWGFSGPAALKLSAWAARYLHEKQYQVELCVDWLPGWKRGSIEETLAALRSSRQGVYSQSPFNLPKNLWKQLLRSAQIEETKRFAELSREASNRIVEKLKGDRYDVRGKTTHKEEFVTCGGVALQEVDFKRMESRLCQGLYFAGELLDIDAVTGGFNFQNAWTTGWIVGQAGQQEEKDEI